MSLHPSLVGNVLTVRTVGDQSLEEGFRQFETGVEAARGRWSDTGAPVHLCLDLTASSETRETAEIHQIVRFIADRCPPFSGRIAVVAPRDFLYGLSRIFAASAESAGLNARVFRTGADAGRWLDGAGADPERGPDSIAGGS